jgi:hypothetical protein
MTLIEFILANKIPHKIDEEDGGIVVDLDELNELPVETRHQFVNKCEERVKRFMRTVFNLKFKLFE